MTRKIQEGRCCHTSRCESLPQSEKITPACSPLSTHCRRGDEKIEARRERSKNASQQLDGLAKFQQDLKDIADQDGAEEPTPEQIKSWHLTLQRLNVELKNMPQHFETLRKLSSQLSGMVLRAVTRHVEQHLAPFMASVVLHVKSQERPPAFPTFAVEVLRDCVASPNNRANAIFRAHDELPSAVFLLKFLMSPGNYDLPESSAEALLAGQSQPSENPDEEAQFLPSGFSGLWKQCRSRRICAQSCAHVHQDTVNQLQSFADVLVSLGKEGLRAEPKRCQAHIKAQVVRSLEADHPGSACFKLWMSEQMQRFAAVKFLDTAEKCKNSALAAETFFKWARESLEFIKIQAGIDETSTKPSKDATKASQGLGNMRALMIGMETRGFNEFLADLLGNDPDELSESTMSRTGTNCSACWWQTSRSPCKT